MHHLPLLTLPATLVGLLCSCIAELMRSASYLSSSPVAVTMFLTFLYWPLVATRQASFFTPLQGRWSGDTRYFDHRMSEQPSSAAAVKLWPEGSQWRLRQRWTLEDGRSSERHSSFELSQESGQQQAVLLDSDDPLLTDTYSVVRASTGGSLSMQSLSSLTSKLVMTSTWQLIDESHLQTCVQVFNSTGQLVQFSVTNLARTGVN